MCIMMNIVVNTDSVNLYCVILMSGTVHHPEKWVLCSGIRCYRIKVTVAFTKCVHFVIVTFEFDHAELTISTEGLRSL